MSPEVPTSTPYEGYCRDMKWGIVAAVAAIIGIIVALLVREQGQRAMDEAELWAEAGEPESDEDPDFIPESA